MVNIKKYAVAAGLGILGALVTAGLGVGGIPGLVIGGAVNGAFGQITQDIQAER